MRVSSCRSSASTLIGCRPRVVIRLKILVLRVGVGVGVGVSVGVGVRGLVTLVLLVIRRRRVVVVSDNVGGADSGGSVAHHVFMLLSEKARVFTVHVVVEGCVAPGHDVSVHSVGVLRSIGAGQVVVEWIHLHWLEAAIQVVGIALADHRVAGVGEAEGGENTVLAEVRTIGQKGTELVGIVTLVSDAGGGEEEGIDLPDSGVEAEVDGVDVEVLVARGSRRNDLAVYVALVRRHLPALVSSGIKLVHILERLLQSSP